MNLSLLADLDPHTFWNAANSSTELVLKCLGALLFGCLIFAGCYFAPSQFRRYIIFGFTFVAGLFYVLFYYFPQPIAKQPTDLARNPAEAFSFWLADAQPIVAVITNAVGAFLIGLGVYSLLRVHLRKVSKQQRDWGYSVVLLVSMALMAFFGYWDFKDSLGSDAAALALGQAGGAWKFENYANDLLFDGLLQQMDAGMFSVVAFFILSAAYRAFRARSIEATILLTSALIMILSVMGGVVYLWDQAVVQHLALNNPNAFLNNLRLTDMAMWLKNTIQTPALRGIEFGVGIGLLAMGLRLWLNLDKTGGAL